MMSQWLITNFSTIGNWSSIIGLGVSLWVLYSVKKIKLHFTLKARIPELIYQLEEYSKTFNSLLNDIKSNRMEIITTSKKLEFTLQSLNNKANANIDEAIKIMFSRIKKLKNGKDNFVNALLKKGWSFDDESWNLYTDLQGVLQGLKESKKDAEWDLP
jgi:hypothetical protein